MGEVRPITETSLWDDFVEASPQGTIFSRTAWLKLFNAPYKIMGYFKGNNLMGGFACFDTPQPLTPFQGILVAPIEGKYTTIMSLHNEVAKALMPYLPNEFYNHYSYPDIRPFKWAGWSVDVRYTYIVDLVDMSKTWVQLEKQTRYEINNYKEKWMMGVPLLRQFDTLYAHTFERKGLERPVCSELIKKIDEHIGLFIYMTANGETGVGMIRDKKGSCYILGASEGKGDSSFCLWKALESESSYSKKCDLVGCNSEKIGLFKRGFGGSLQCYFGVKRGS